MGPGSRLLCTELGPPPALRTLEMCDYFPRFRLRQKPARVCVPSLLGGPQALSLVRFSSSSGWKPRFPGDLHLLCRWGPPPCFREAISSMESLISRSYFGFISLPRPVQRGWFCAGMGCLLGTPSASLRHAVLPPRGWPRLGSLGGARGILRRPRRAAPLTNSPIFSHGGNFSSFRGSETSRWSESDQKPG